MAQRTNPAVQAFVERIGSELVLAQVWISRTGKNYELRHVADRNTTIEKLKSVQPDELRAVAQSTADGAFRPLKSAPNLRPGWRLVAKDDAELEDALNQLYPGAIADWYAAQSPAPPVTHYRDFTGRQTGMYRITTLLSDADAGRVIRACCHATLCLKHRLWTVEGLAPDPAEEKSLIPCLEPCAMLSEFARKAMRLEQEDKMKIELSSDELATIRDALETVLGHRVADAREADFNSQTNPRRLRLLLEKLAALPNPHRVKSKE
jgi:hypothetical protein